MPRDVAVQNTPAIVANNEEAIEYGEGDRRNREEIHRRDGLPMVTQKSKPALGWIRVCGRSFHPAGNRSFGNVQTEHEKFSVDAGSSPAGILGHHLEDEIANLFRCRLSAHGLANLRNHPPVPTESGAMPADHSFGRDD